MDELGKGISGSDGAESTNDVVDDVDNVEDEDEDDEVDSDDVVDDVELAPVPPDVELLVGDDVVVDVVDVVADVVDDVVEDVPGFGVVADVVEPFLAGSTVSSDTNDVVTSLPFNGVGGVVIAVVSGLFSNSFDIITGTNKQHIIK